MWKVSYSNQREIQTALYLSQDVVFKSADVLMSRIYGGANLRILKNSRNGLKRIRNDYNKGVNSWYTLVLLLKS